MAGGNRRRVVCQVGQLTVNTQTPLTFPAHKAARTTDPTTSHTAARKAVGNSKLRGHIFLIHEATRHGLTDDELRTAIAARGINANHGSVAKRRGDLVRDGILIATDQRRRSNAGQPQIVWGRP